jgi:protein-S-isoprenylcysteine O-methyltransferase Ste14
LSLHLPQSLIHWLLGGAAAAAVTFFAVGLTLYFERSPRPLWVMAVHYVSMVLAILQVAGVLLLTPRSDAFAALGIVMYSLSIALYLSAIEAARRTRLQRSFVDHPLPDRLITDGPYRWVRHPFGAGYLLGALAAPLAIADLRMFLIAIPLMIATVLAAAREERVWLSSPRADEYREYRRKTGMFIPFIGRDV